VSANTAQKLRREANSLLGLSVINIVSSAMVLAFGSAALFPNIITMIQTQTVLFPEIVWAVLGLLAFIIGIRWLVATAEVLEIHEQLKEGSEKAQDEDALTGVIIGAMASYREKKGTIKAMLLISRIAGVGFIASVIYSIISTVISGNLWLLTGIIPNLAIAVAAFIIPYYFSKYQQIWDSRLRDSENAEKLFKQHLGTE
jgi:hypothetical protein